MAMTNYRIWIHDDNGNGVVSETLIQANSIAEAAEFYVQSIIDEDISISPSRMLSKNTRIRIERQRLRETPGKVTFGNTREILLSGVDAWNKYRRAELPEQQERTIADTARQTSDNDLPDAIDSPSGPVPGTLNIYMITNRRDPWNKSKITNLFQAESMAKAADAFVRSIAEYGGARPVFHKGLRFQVIEYRMPQDAGRMDLDTFKWYSAKDHPR